MAILKRGSKSDISVVEHLTYYCEKCNTSQTIAENAFGEHLCKECGTKMKLVYVCVAPCKPTEIIEPTKD